MRFTWAVDGYGRRWPCSNDFMNGQFVIFSPLCEEYFLDCMDLLNEQYNGKK
jgi:hypothetical protein